MCGDVLFADWPVSVHVFSAFHSLLFDKISIQYKIAARGKFKPQISDIFIQLFRTLENFSNVFQQMFSLDNMARFPYNPILERKQ